MDWTQEEMFSVPKRYAPRKADPKWPRWRKHGGKRMSCDDCIMALANHTTNFMPEAAKFTREDVAGRRYYCSLHAHMRKESEHS